MHVDTSNGVWTSGSNEGLGCDIENKFSWCSMHMQFGASMMVDKQLWTTIPDGRPTSERCIALNYDAAAGSTTLKRSECLGQNKNFICQVGGKNTRNLLFIILFCN
jgi:hypothetical protein